MMLQTTRDLCKIPIFGTFLRCALLESLPIFMICLRFLSCYNLELYSNLGFCKGPGLLLPISVRFAIRRARHLCRRKSPSGRRRAGLGKRSDRG